MKILGLGSPFQHDPSAALVIDGEIVAAAEEERFNRRKHAVRDLAVNSTRYCLESAGVRPEDVDIVAFPWSPETFARQRWAYARRCLVSRPSRAWKALTSLRKELRYREEKIKKTLEAVGIEQNKVEVRYVDHHIAHASSAYHVSGFDAAAILTIDGAGEFASTVFFEAEGTKIRKFHEILQPDSLGFFYMTITEYLGFRRNDGEYKVMGMAPYGDPRKFDIAPFIGIDGEDFAVSDDFVRVIRSKRFEADKAFSRLMVERWGPPRNGDGLNEPFIHIAAAAQKALEDITLRLIEVHLKDVLERRGGRLCLAGGCALNVRLNRKILQHPLVKEVFVQPAAHDAGTSLGAATFVATESGESVLPMTHAYLGPEYSDDDILAVLNRRRLPYEELDDPVEAGADLLEKGEVIAWFQGRMEFGPRALGNRSILANPSVKGVSDDISQRIKFREKWRPFCPAVLADKAAEILNSNHPSRSWRSASWSTKRGVEGFPRSYTSMDRRGPRWWRITSARFSTG